MVLKELGPHMFNKLEDCHALATKVLKQTLEENAQTKATIEALQHKVEDLQRSLAEMRLHEEESRHWVLLGQLVYVLEDIVRIQVLGPNFPPTSLADIQDLIEQGFVSEEGQRKWNTFFTRLAGQGLSVKKVIAASAPLRPQRFALAHGTMEERATVSTAQLREWACGRNLQPMVDTILKALQPLTYQLLHPNAFPLAQVRANAPLRITGPVAAAVAPA
ncbi:hypothetical protein PLESTF_000585400 [Pleodorina starrii]|nr:hypothetical protein PLESTF_000585400 [Pleodorina starrii]